MTPEHKALVARLRLYQTGGERKYIPLDCATVEEAADAIEALARADDEYEAMCEALQAAEAKMAAVLDMLGFDPEEILQARAAPKPRQRTEP